MSADAYVTGACRAVLVAALAERRRLNGELGVALIMALTRGAPAVRAAAEALNENGRALREAERELAGGDP